MTMVDVKRSLPMIIENYKESNLNELSFIQSNRHQGFQPNIYTKGTDSLFTHWYDDEYELNVNKALEPVPIIATDGANTTDSIHTDSEEVNTECLSCHYSSVSSTDTSIDDAKEVKTGCLSCHCSSASITDTSIDDDKMTSVHNDETENEPTQEQKHRASLWKKSLEHCSQIVMSSRRKSMEGGFLLTDFDACSSHGSRSAGRSRRNSVGYFLNQSEGSPRTQRWTQDSRLYNSQCVFSDTRKDYSNSTANSSFTESFSGPMFDSNSKENPNTSELTSGLSSEELLKRSGHESDEFIRDGHSDKSENEDLVFSNSTSPRRDPIDNATTNTTGSHEKVKEDVLVVPVRFRENRLSSSEGRKLSISDEFFVEKMLFGLNIPTRNDSGVKAAINSRIESDRTLSPCTSHLSSPRRSSSLISVAENEDDLSFNTSRSEFIQQTKMLSIPISNKGSPRQQRKLINCDFSALSRASPLCSTPISESPPTLSYRGHPVNSFQNEKSLSSCTDIVEDKMTTDTPTEPQTDLELLQEAATRLKLSIRRPSILAWRQKFVDNCNPMTGTDYLDNSVDESSEDKDTFSELRKLKINGDLEWIRKELQIMKNLDQSLAGQFLFIRDEIRRLKLQRSCEEHEELLEDVIDEMKERDELSEFLDAPVDLIECNPLKHLGVTRMNITNRRFSMC